MHKTESRIGAAIAGGVLFVPAAIELLCGNGTSIGAHLMTAALGLGLIAVSLSVRLG